MGRSVMKTIFDAGLILEIERPFQYFYTKDRLSDFPQVKKTARDAYGQHTLA